MTEALRSRIRPTAGSRPDLLQRVLIGMYGADGENDRLLVEAVRPQLYAKACSRLEALGVPVQDLGGRIEALIARELAWEESFYRLGLQELRTSEKPRRGAPPVDFYEALVLYSAYIDARPSKVGHTRACQVAAQRLGPSASPSRVRKSAKCLFRWILLAASHGSPPISEAERDKMLCDFISHTVTELRRVEAEMKTEIGAEEKRRYSARHARFSAR